MKRFLLGLACSGMGLSMLAGCDSLRSPGGAVAAPAVPAAWHAAAGVAAAVPDAGAPPALAAWWRRFADPTLDALVGEALAEATEVQAARARLRAARAARDLAAAGLRPSVGANASAPPIRDKAS